MWTELSPLSVAVIGVFTLLVGVLLGWITRGSIYTKFSRPPKRRYSRDFLLQFQPVCKQAPAGFVAPEVAPVPHPSPRGPREAHAPPVRDRDRRTSDAPAEDTPISNYLKIRPGPGQAQKPKTKIMDKWMLEMLAARQAGDAEACCAVLDRWRRETGGSEERSELFDEAVSACLDADQLERGYQLFMAMQDAGMTPDVHLYDRFVQVLANRQSQVREGRGRPLLLDRRGLGAHAHDHDHGNGPDGRGRPRRGPPGAGGFPARSRDGLSKRPSLSEAGATTAGTTGPTSPPPESSGASGGPARGQSAPRGRGGSRKPAAGAARAPAAAATTTTPAAMAEPGDGAGSEHAPSGAAAPSFARKRRGSGKSHQTSPQPPASQT